MAQSRYPMFTFHVCTSANPAYDWGVGPLHLDPSQASSASVVKVLCKDLVAQRIAAHSYGSRCWTFQCRLQSQDIPPKNDQEDNTSKGGNVGTPAAFAKTPRSLRICLKKMSRTFGSVRIFLNSSSPAPWLQPQPPKPFQRIHIICIQKQSENVLHTKYWCDYLFLWTSKACHLSIPGILYNHHGRGNQAHVPPFWKIERKKRVRLEEGLLSHGWYVHIVFPGAINHHQSMSPYNLGLRSRDVSLLVEKFHFSQGLLARLDPEAPQYQLLVWGYP